MEKAQILQGSSASDDTGDEDVASPLTGEIAGHQQERGESRSGEVRGHGRPKLFLALLTVSSALGGLLFGFDTAVISGALLIMQKDIPVTTFEKELVVSATVLFAAFASVGVSHVADRYGRKLVIQGGSMAFAVGAGWLAISPKVWHLIAARSIVGIGLGMSSTIVPVYLSECAPPKFRGRMSVIYNLFVTGGQFIAACICAMLAESSPHGGWRIMFGVGVIPALMQFAAFCYLPETPVWLMAKGKSGKALQVLQRMGRGVEQRDHSVGGVERGPSLNVVDIVCGRADERVNRALRLGMLLQFLQQSTAINVVMYYGTLIVKQSGVKSDTDSLYVNIVIALVNFVFSSIGMMIVDTHGRRPLLLWSLGLVNAMLVLLAVAFGLSAPSWIIIVSICLYLITFAQECRHRCICAEILLAAPRSLWLFLPLPTGLPIL